VRLAHRNGREIVVLQRTLARLRTRERAREGERETEKQQRLLREES